MTKSLSSKVSEKLSGLPRTAGIYRFFNYEGRILYIGKAVNLRRRVKQYFGSAPVAWDNRIRSMVSVIHDLDWVGTNTELEALLLEDTQIKQHWPDYNARQKKFLQQAYLFLSGGPYPYLAVKERSSDLSDRSTSTERFVFGPFSDRFYAMDLMIAVNDALGLRSCTDPQPHRNCVRQGCMGPCAGTDPEIYGRAVKQATEFLNGIRDDLLAELSGKMEACSDRQEYRRAARLRDQLTFCQRFWRRQRFYRQFLQDKLIIEDDGFYLFVRGRFVGFWLNRQELERAKTPKAESVEQDWILFDRAMVVLSWINNSKTVRSYTFLPASN